MYKYGLNFEYHSVFVSATHNAFNIIDQMLLFNTPQLFLIVILTIHFVEGKKLSEASSDRKCKKVCDKYLNDKAPVIQQVFDDVNHASSTNFPHNVSFYFKKNYVSLLILSFF